MSLIGNEQIFSIHIGHLSNFVLKALIFVVNNCTHIYAFFRILDGTEIRNEVRKSPIKHSGRVTFDEPDDDSVNADQKNDRVINEASVGEPEPDVNVDEGGHMMMEYDKRRMSLKSAGPEVRMDSVESTEVRIHIKESY